MRLTRFLAALILAAGFSVSAARAQNAPDPNASEELSRQVLADMNALAAQIRQKLNSSRPATTKDLDAVLNDQFFSGTGDPFAALEQLRQKMDGQQGRGKEKFDDLYQKWSSERLDTQELEPETSEEGDKVVMDFKAPEGAGDSLDLNINKSRIRMNYAVKDVREHTRTDGTTYTTSFFRRSTKLMPLPKGVNPAGYKVEKSARGVRVTFQKNTIGNKAEASK